MLKRNYRNRESFKKIRLNSQEQYMLGSLVKMVRVPEHLHVRLRQAMNEIGVCNVARETAELFMNPALINVVSDEAHDVWLYLIYWAGKEKEYGVEPCQ